jgi:hypothetical protein
VRRGPDGSTVLLRNPLRRRPRGPGRPTAGVSQGIG